MRRNDPRWQKKTFPSFVTLQNASKLDMLDLRSQPRTAKKWEYKGQKNLRYHNPRHLQMSLPFTKLSRDGLLEISECLTTSYTKYDLRYTPFQSLFFNRVSQRRGRGMRERIEKYSWLPSFRVKEKKIAFFAFFLGNHSLYPPEQQLRASTLMAQSLPTPFEILPVHGFPILTRFSRVQKKERSSFFSMLPE